MDLSFILGGLATSVRGVWLPQLTVVPTWCREDRISFCHAVERRRKRGHDRWKKVEKLYAVTAEEINIDFPANGERFCTIDRFLCREHGVSENLKRRECSADVTKRK